MITSARLLFELKFGDDNAHRNAQAIVEKRLTIVNIFVVALSFGLNKLERNTTRRVVNFTIKFKNKRHSFCLASKRDELRALACSSVSSADRVIIARARCLPLASFSPILRVSKRKLRRQQKL